MGNFQDIIAVSFRQFVYLLSVWKYFQMSLKKKNYCVVNYHNNLKINMFLLNSRQFKKINYLQNCLDSVKVSNIFWKNLYVLLQG